MEVEHRILLVITGSVAAFKGATLASDLTKRGYEVRTILTDGGARFISPLTLEALTGKPAAVSIWDEQPGSTRMGHLDLARWAERLVVAPASAGSMARLALGLSDDLLGAVALATAAPLFVAPAMEPAMFAHPATQQHLETLRSRGASIIGPVSGRLASGAEGLGRMVEPSEVAEVIDRSFRGEGSLWGRSVLVTAGPTYEPIDPIRFIGNRSSGKMGYAVAAEAIRRGAQVTLISGPVAVSAPAGAQVVPVETTAQMRSAVLEHLHGKSVVVMAAAIADFKPEVVSAEKVKRGQEHTLQLTSTTDIAAEAARAAPKAVHVGFALETSDLESAARKKLERKGQDLVVANAVSEEHNPFGSDTNRVLFVTRAGVESLPELRKIDVASALWDDVARLLVEKNR